jgi:flavin prenyltransferase
MKCFKKMTNKKTQKIPVRKIVLAICGASGSIYGIRLTKSLVQHPVELYMVISNAGKKVMAHETNYSGAPFTTFLKNQGFLFHQQAELREFDKDDLFAPPASGSFQHQGMVIAPCSMNTLGAIASGIADDLIRRAADVTLKERRPLILLIRESPLNTIHLENMRKLNDAGAIIMPACPGFYHHPRSINDLVDSMVARILDHLQFGHDLVTPWGEEGNLPIHV